MFAVFLLSLLMFVGSAELCLIEDLIEQVKSLQASVTALNNTIDVLKKRAAFMTSVASDVTVPSGVTVQFGKVQYNEGDGYNVSTGIFTAPVSGIYSFFFKMETAPGQTCALFMTKEGERLLYILGSDPHSHDTPSAEVVVHVKHGERVWVEGARPGTVVREHWTRFGGFLVRPDLPGETAALPGSC